MATAIMEVGGLRMFSGLCEFQRHKRSQQEERLDSHLGVLSIHVKTNIAASSYPETAGSQFRTFVHQESRARPVPAALAAHLHAYMQEASR